MQTMHEFDAMITKLPLSERVVMRDRLDESIDASLSMSHAAMEQADFAFMEKRLDAYEAGLIQGSPWEVVEARIRESLSL